MSLRFPNNAQCCLVGRAATPAPDLQVRPTRVRAAARLRSPGPSPGESPAAPRKGCPTPKMWHHGGLVSARSVALYRIAAVLLLLLAGAEIGVCCSNSSSVFESCDPDGPSPGDGCLCCCRHIVVVPAVTLAPAAFLEFTLPPARIFHTLTLASRIDHPPRA